MSAQTFHWYLRFHWLPTQGWASVAVRKLCSAHNYSSVASNFFCLENLSDNTKTPAYKNCCTQTIVLDWEKGYVWNVFRSEIGKFWTEPHHLFQNPDKRGKLRRIRKAAFKSDWRFLPGPDVPSDLFGVFSSFSFFSGSNLCRYWRSVHGEFQFNLCRLSWLVDIADEIGLFQHTRHIFVDTSSPWYANFAVQQTVRY